MKRFLYAVFAATAILLVGETALPTAAYASPASDITKYCSFEPSSNAGSFKKAVDGKDTTVWKGEAEAGQSIEITIKKDVNPGGLYFRWDSEPPAWELYAVGEDGNATLAVSGGGNGFLTDYESIPADFAQYRKFKLTSSDGSLRFAIAELQVFGEGDAPSYAPHWQPFAGRADVMIFSGHPDDDSLYMGSVIPTYTNQGKQAVTVYMTYGAARRRFEGMEGSWTMGERICPVLGPFPDTYAKGEIGPVKKDWPEEQTEGFIVEQIRKFKPSVIVTHDIKGEYGHGAHMWTSQMVQQAFEKSGDPSCYPESANKYGIWSAAKLYLHIYKKDKLTIDATVPLDQYNGKTAFEMATAAYERHISQHVFDFKVRIKGTYNIQAFGLFSSRVGDDTLHTDMFENVTDESVLKLNMPAGFVFIGGRIAQLTR